MPPDFAFLRGINVGGRTVRSAELRAAFEAMGLGGAETFLASGNVIFRAGDEDPTDLERRIEAGVREALGFDAAAFIRSCDHLVAAAAPARLDASALARQPGVTVNVILLKEPPTAELRAAVLALRTGDDDFLALGRELYWLRRGGISDSPAWAPLEKAIAGRGTTRNLNTLRRLVAKFCTERA